MDRFWIPFFALVALCTGASADNKACAAAAARAEQKQAFLSPPESQRVLGPGRLYFHGAPQADCRSKDVFVIPGDQLTAYTEYQGWYSVMYMNPATGDDFQGWVRADRLKSTGTVGPKP
jgi:hypothetical protein